MWFFWIVLALAVLLYTGVAGIFLLFFSGAGVAFMTLIVGFGGAFYMFNKAEENV